MAWEYVLPYNTKEERFNILTVCRKHDLAVELGHELIKFAEASFERVYEPLKDKKHCMLCGNELGRYTYNYFGENNVLVVPFTQAIDKHLGIDIEINIGASISNDATWRYEGNNSLQLFNMMEDNSKRTDL